MGTETREILILNPTAANMVVKVKLPSPAVQVRFQQVFSWRDGLIALDWSYRQIHGGVSNRCCGLRKECTTVQQHHPISWTFDCLVPRWPCANDTKRLTCKHYHWPWNSCGWCYCILFFVILQPVGMVLLERHIYLSCMNKNLQCFTSKVSTNTMEYSWHFRQKSPFPRNYLVQWPVCASCSTRQGEWFVIIYVVQWVTL